ncbi:MAG: type IIL restriction-modification enzyme MmeI, partial [Actinomycetes bacterium]
MPKVSSSRRNFVPGAYLDAEVIAGDKLIVFPDAELWLFALLHSSMWNAWVRTVGGRLKSDIDLSVDLVFNAFPFPQMHDASKANLALAAQRILDARAAHHGASLADLYDPLSMPTELVKAHDALDNLVDSQFAPGKKLDHPPTGRTPRIGGSHVN